MLAGIKVNIDGEELVIPPISLGQLRNGALTLLKEHDILIQQGKTFEAMEIRGQVIYSALKRNYPDYDEARLFAYLDLGNAGAIWLSILGASGFAPGEAQAVKDSTYGTSDPSTEASPPPTVGHTMK